MDYENPIDNAIHRFQHRWETDRQFRSAMSGVFGLLLIVCLCGGVGVLDMGATRALAAVGIGGTTTDQSGAASQQNIETGVTVNGNTSFPTPGVPTWGVPVIPQAQPNPTSSSLAPTPTPSPTPTDVPTAGPCHTGCGGGGVNGKISASWSPSSWATGSTGASFTVYATDLKGNPVSGVGIAVIYTWATKTYLDENPLNVTDSSGNYVSRPPLVGTCRSGGDMAYVQAHFPGYPSNVEVTNTWLIPCS